ncbi:hypothetical protein HY945_05390 [Candidatus Gottesmanbacteria bacterium]|nr:hypothetical protein [Candidatus Gottesmanbacteria bacterium]
MANPAPEKPAFALLPQEALIEFKQIYKEEFGVELPDEEAVKKATAVLNIVKVLAKKPVLQKE